MSKREKPETYQARPIWTYWISRDSIQGELSGKCHLWCRKPTRTKHGYRVAWLNTDEHDPGHVGEYDLKDIQAWFRVIPDTDLELIRCEMCPTDAQLTEAAKAKA